MRGGSWREFDKALQRELEEAKAQGPEAYEKKLKETNHTYATVGGAQAGALAGGAIGTFVPVIGTVVGAFIGAFIGGFIGHDTTK